MHRRHETRPSISFNPLQDLRLRVKALLALRLPAAVVAAMVVVVVVGSFSQQSSPSPQEQLSLPQTRSLSHSLSASQSPSPSAQKSAPPLVQHWSLPEVRHEVSLPLPLHGLVAGVVPGGVVLVVVVAEICHCTVYMYLCTIDFVKY